MPECDLVLGSLLTNDIDESQADDLRAAIADSIINKVEEMNARDRQAAESLGLSLVGGEVLTVSQLPAPTPPPLLSLPVPRLSAHKEISGCCRDHHGRC